MENMLIISLIISTAAILSIGFAIYLLFSSIQKSKFSPTKNRQKNHRAETDELIEQFMFNLEKRIGKKEDINIKPDSSNGPNEDLK